MTLYVKLAAVALMLAMCSGLYLTGHHMGASAVQAKWDAQKKLDAVAVAKVEGASQQHTKDTEATFGDILNNYLATYHEMHPPVADSVSAGVSDGSLKLRDNPVCSGERSALTASSRALDAAYTQALADRISHSIAAVRSGDLADERERQLDAQVKGLQDVLKAERR
jgi:hypothetical protein